MEQWKWVPGYRGKYEVSDLGRVRSYVIPTLLKPHKMKTGYMVVDFGGKDCTVHRLVASAFVPNRRKQPEANHRDGQKWNNAKYNLEWVSHVQNLRHAGKTGLLSGRNCARGEAAHKSHLTERDVLAIRELYQRGGTTHRQLAAQYRVDRYCIYAILNRKTWTHI